MNRVLADLSATELPDDLAERRSLSRSWQSAAALIHDAEGDSPLYYDAIQTAHSLDPENEELAQEAERQLLRQRIFQQRVAIAEAERLSRSQKK